jgi:hypothetical protein
VIDRIDRVDGACCADAPRREVEATERFCFPAEWSPPERMEWRRGFGGVSLDVPTLDAEGIDVRDRVWWILRLAGASETDRDEMMLPFLNGFWHLSDGMTSPIWRGTLAWAGMPKHPLFVAHDWDYFTGRKSRRTADADMWRRMELFGWPLHRRLAVWGAVRLAGWKAWRTHARRRRIVEGYGTERWMSMLQVNN